MESEWKKESRDSRFVLTTNGRYRRNFETNGDYQTESARNFKLSEEIFAMPENGQEFAGKSQKPAFEFRKWHEFFVNPFPGLKSRCNILHLPSDFAIFEFTDGISE